MATATAVKSKSKSKSRGNRKISFRPLDDRLVIEPADADEKTTGGIILPESAREKPQRGTVVCTGPGKLLGPRPVRPPRHGRSRPGTGSRS